jgi:hypothetical protein
MLVLVQMACPSAGTVCGHDLLDKAPNLGASHSWGIESYPPS